MADYGMNRDYNGPKHASVTPQPLEELKINRAVRSDDGPDLNVEIAALLDGAQKEFHELKERLDHFYELLSPIMTPDLPTESEDMDAPANRSVAPLSPIADDLVNFSRRIGLASAKLVYMKGRVQL